MHYEYTGGAFIPGVPARTLSPAESERFASIIDAHQADGRMAIYTKIQPKPKPAAKTKDKE